MLAARINALLDDVDRARLALDRLRDRAPEFHKGIRPEIERTLTSQGQKLRATTADLTPDRTTAAWSVILDATQKLRPVYRDLYAAVQGAEARASGLDNGLLDMADALLDELGVADEFKARMTVLADREFYPGDPIAEMIRLRFPETTIWAMPVAAHEFAHFLFRSLRVEEPSGGKRFPFDAVFKRPPDAANRARLEELAADVVATFALGPAYAFTAVLLRFVPRSRDKIEQHPHPSDAARVDAITRTLERQVPGDPEPPFNGQAAHVRATWIGMGGVARDLGSEGTEPAGTDADDLGLLERHWDAIVQAIDETIPHIRYRTIGRAAGVAASLASGVWRQQSIGDLTIADLLNASWIARLVAQDDRRTLVALEQETRTAIQARTRDEEAIGAGGHQ